MATDLPHFSPFFAPFPFCIFSITRPAISVAETLVPPSWLIIVASVRVTSLELLRQVLWVAGFFI